MANAPIQLTIYNSDHEPVKELSTSIVPWGIFKRALGLIKSLKGLAQFDGPVDQEKVMEMLASLSDADIDNLTGLVVDVFPGRVTVKELENGTEIGEMLTVLMVIIRKAFASMDPTKPG